MTNATPDLIEEFLDVVHARLAQGARAYAGRSFSRDPAALAAEIEEELADVIGWSFILWARVRALRGAVDTALPPVERRRESRGARRAIRPRDKSDAELMATLRRLRPEKYRGVWPADQ